MLANKLNHYLSIFLIKFNTLFLSDIDLFESSTFRGNSENYLIGNFVHFYFWDPD